MSLFRRRAAEGNVELRPTYRWQVWRRRRGRDEFELGPDGAREHLFLPLGDSDPALADSLRRRFVERWLPESGLPPSRFDEAMATVDIRVGPDEEDEDEQVLRVAIGFNGSTRYLYEWSGDPDEAAAFVDEAAHLEATTVHFDRRLHGPTPWD